MTINDEHASSTYVAEGPDVSSTKLSSTKLWEHPDPQSTQMWTFLQHMNRKHGLQLQMYWDLHAWSIDNLATFWAEVWDFVGITASKPFHEVVDEDAPMFPPPKWFQSARLNFAENLLFPTAGVDPDSPAIIAVSETTEEEISWSQLRERVRACQASLIAIGLKEGDRVAGYVANHANAVVAMLAATSIGGIWTAMSPDTGAYAVLERLRQIEPAILFTDNAAFYNGRPHPILPKVAEITAGLQGLRGVVVFDTVPSLQVDISSIKPAAGSAYSYASFLDLGAPTSELTFAQLLPDQPVYILYSSGTTGAPKCIVHGAIGTLLQHKKEHILHCSITPASRLFYFTTCAWMMWHWLVSGLASGATIVLYDGSPFRAPSPLDLSTSILTDLAMPQLISRLRVTHFGTSAKYLSILEQKDVQPLRHVSLPSLQAIYSTGSPLAPSTFAYIYRVFPSSINLGSITGGTDIISLFGAPCPLLPVHAGEIQAPGLGMAIAVYDPDGIDISRTGIPGDLVCRRPFPCQPVGFWGPGGADRYRRSYFDAFGSDAPIVWHHGDFVRLNPATGGLWMLGRSDGVLNPAGVRFGSAEIYHVLLRHFSQVQDALCVGRRRRPDDPDESVVLFLKMHDGYPFDADLVQQVKDVIRAQLSARHVPAVVDECLEIPVTGNGKKIEGAVKQILCGMDVKISASAANPECLDFYRKWARTH